FLQPDLVVAGSGRFIRMRKSGLISAPGLILGPGDKRWFADLLHEEKIAQVRTTRAAQVREAEALDGWIGVFIPRIRVPILSVRVRTDLDHAEGRRGTRKRITLTLGADEGMDIIRQPRFGSTGGDCGNHCT